MRFKTATNRLRLLVARATNASGMRKSAAKDRVTVLVPTLPRRVELLRTQSLPSILRQSHQDFYVFVVSEKFSEEIQKVVDEFDDRFAYIWGYRKSAKLQKAEPIAHWMSGNAPALNMALKKVRGPFIAQLDDDDEWFPNHLENSIKYLESTASEFVSSRALEASGALMVNYMLSDEYYGDEYEWANLAGVVGTPTTWVYRSHLNFLKFNKNSWRKVHNRPADIDFSLRLAAMGAKIGFLESLGGRAIERPSAEGLVGSQAFIYEGTTDAESPTRWWWSFAKREK